MQQYLDAVQDVLTTGQRQSNRTGTDTLFKHGLYMTFDLADGFPLLTTKEVNWQSCFAEMLGFWRGLDNARDFESLGTKVWNANADHNSGWNENVNKSGPGDLGRIYGVQARDWQMGYRNVDQLAKVYNDLRAGIDDRREIVTHWNPGELTKMALPPCHLLYQFGRRPGPVQSDTPVLDLFVYIRSNDMGLGMPFNIAGYAWLLSVMAHITNHTPGILHYFAWNYHIYVNHIRGLEMQIKREPRKLPHLIINPFIETLDDMDTTTGCCTGVCVQDFAIAGYNPHPVIPMKMAV